MFNPVIFAAIIIQYVVSKSSRIAGAVIGYAITTGILLWGISLYGEGKQIALFGIPLSGSIFLLACLVWYGLDTRELLAAKEKPIATNRLVLEMKNNKDWMKRLDAAEALAQKNDRRGLDYLNKSLKSSNADIREVAKEIIEGLGAHRDGSPETSKPHIGLSTKNKALTPKAIEIRQRKKAAKAIYRQKVLKVHGRCIICGEKLGIMDRLKGKTYCSQHQATQ